MTFECLQCGMPLDRPYQWIFNKKGINTGKCEAVVQCNCNAIYTVRINYVGEPFDPADHQTTIPQMLEEIENDEEEL